MADKLRDKKGHGEVIEEFSCLRDGIGARLDVRVIEYAGVRKLDIRQNIVSGGAFNGYTRKGISLTEEELDILLEQIPAIQKVMEKAKKRR